MDMELTRRRTVTSWTLKWIAIVTMAVDHTGVVFVRELPIDTYQLMRHIGRIAFPIFCFLLVEGFRHTRNRWKYLRNLAIFALVSEAPYDLALLGWYRRGAGMNVFCTLALGLLGMIVTDQLVRWCRTRGLERLTVLCYLLPMLLLGRVAFLLNTDYAEDGVLMVYLIYIGESLEPYVFREVNDRQLVRNLLGVLGILLWFCQYDFSLGMLVEMYGMVCVVPLLFYSGERGTYRLSKWAFYGFYPVHLLLLYGIRTLALGLAG